MANTKIPGRQKPLVAVTPIMTIANIGAGLGYDIGIPAGSYVREVYLDTLVAFDSATTTTGTITDGTTVFVNAQDLKTTGRETSAVVNKYYPNGGTISINIAQTGAGATVGQAFASIEMIGLNRVDEVYTG